MYMCIDYKLHNKCKYSRVCDISMRVVYMYSLCYTCVYVHVNTLIYLHTPSCMNINVHLQYIYLHNLHSTYI